MTDGTFHEYLRQLLYRHNCVILPGFGGIVLQYAPARVHPAQHIFQPPRKALAFNRSLTTNDGLLIAHVANAEQLRYEDAEASVRRCINQIETSIRRKGDYTLPGIGRFHNDIEGNLQFDADESRNFLLSAYGLDKFVSPAVVRRDAFEPALAAKAERKRKRRFSWFKFIVVALVVVFAGVELLSWHDLSRFVKSPTASFNIFNDSYNSKLSSATRSAAPPKHDTVVNIIVIKDETTTPTANNIARNLIADSASLKNISSITPAATKDNSTSITAASTATAPVEIKKIVLSADELARERAHAKVPLDNEYNPSALGKYIVVFSNSKDSAHAAYYQHTLWKDRIGVRLLPYHHRYVVAKQGYLTAQAAAKDYAIYRLMGYAPYVQKMK